MLSALVDRAIGRAPIGVMAYAALDRALDPALVDALFDEHARAQYTRTLLLSDLVGVMAAVVCRAQPSVRQAYAADPPAASLAAVYAKLAGVEPGVARELVRDTGARLKGVIDGLRPAPDPWFPGHTVRILDGNVLKASHHRLAVLRGTRASALAGLSVTVLDPDRGLAVDWFPAENGHAQERSLLPGVVATVEPGQVWVGDRNFCTAGFLGGILARGGGFLVRQHASAVRVEEVTRLAPAGVTATGAVFEQRVRLANVPGSPEVRRVVVRLTTPTEDGDTEIGLLTTVPAEVAPAGRVADRYRQRWGIEALFHRLTVVLNAEVRPLGYPKAALFGFAVGLVVSNAFAAVAAGLAAGHPDVAVADELSYHAVGWELRGSRELLRLVAEDVGAGWRAMSEATFVGWLKGVAAGADWGRYQKTRRGPKTPRPDRPKCPRYRHVATKKLLDKHRSQSP